MREELAQLEFLYSANYATGRSRLIVPTRGTRDACPTFSYGVRFH